MSSKAAPKKRKVDAITDDVKEIAKKTPHDLYSEEREKFLKENEHIIGSLLIKGIHRDEDDEEDEETRYANYTTEQMNSLRFIMITKNRQEQLDSMGDLILGDQANDNFMMFNTSFSYDVLDSWDTMKQRLARKTPCQKLDMLMAYTLTLERFDYWIQDNEGEMDELVKPLATAWKTLLKKYDDEKLGWDVKYTKPGVLELLKKFKTSIEDMPEENMLGKFNYE